MKQSVSHLIILTISLLTSFIMTSCVSPSSDHSEAQLSQIYYDDKLFRLGELSEINIEIEETEWNDLLKNAADKKYHTCDITINGEKITNVGIRAKGGSSLDDVKAMGNSDRFSFMVKFDKYTEGQNYKGLTKLSLNNNIGDATQMKDVIAYEMSRYIGLAAPLCNYAKISKNSEYFGCYLAVEPVDADFCKRNYGNLNGSLYKPYHNLSYSGDDEGDYAGISEDTVFQADDGSLKRVIAALKSVETGCDIDSHIDTDAILKYMAVQAMVVNFDGLTGQNDHNYYLYEENGRISLIPWDYNLAWGGYTDFGEDEMLNDDMFGMNDNGEELDESQWEEKWEEWYQNLSDEEKAKMQEAEETALAELPSKVINFPIDTPFSGDLSTRSFFMKLLENKDYLTKYHDYLSQLASGYVKKRMFDKVSKLIVKEIGSITGTEKNAFFTNDAFREGTVVLQQIVHKHADSVLGQLNGMIPSTWEGQSMEPDKLIKCDDIDIAKTGGQ